jgi:autotransporter-associated beta strand protein
MNTKSSFGLKFHLPLAVCAAYVFACGFISAQAQVSQIYSVTNWVNDPFGTNANWSVVNTTNSSFFANNGVAANANLYGFSPIGATITLAKPGDTATMTAQVTLGNAGNNNLQFRMGMLYQGANTSDTGWAGYLVANATSAGGQGLYVRQIPNSGQLGSGTGANQPTLPGGTYVFSNTWGSATYNYNISVTYLSSSSTLLKWSLQGISPNTYSFAGRYTNTTATAQGGFSFDRIGFLAGGSCFNGASTSDIVGITNMLVTFGSFGDGIWTNDASGVWSTTNNWLNGVAAGGSGFIADFSQVSLSADRTVTLDTSRSIGQMNFGATSGSTNNWILTNSSGSILTLDSGGSVVPGIAVNQNTATVKLPLVSLNGLAETGAGILVLGGSNTISGSLNLNGGELQFFSLTNLPLVAGGISAVNFGGGALLWAPGNNIDISALGIPISFAGNAGFDTGANNVSFSTGFGDGGIGGLTKLGKGTLTLNGYVSYSGTTKVSNGVLALGSSGSFSASTNIVVLSGATLNVSAAGGLTLNQNLSGAGTVIGNISDSSGVTTASGYAATGAAGTLTISGNLSLNGGGALNFGLANVTTAGGGVNDLIAVTGNLNISGPTALSVNLINGAPGLGTYTLFSYNTFSGSVANLQVPLGFTITNNTTTKTIGLVVTHVPANLTWRGDNSANIWDVDFTANWIQSGTNQFFFAGDAVTFDNTGSDNPPINISASVSPSSVTVNATQSYDFTGAAIVTGKLIKTNTGTLILENNNTYSGPTVIGGGTLQVGGNVNSGMAGTLGAGPITNNGALVFDLAQNYSVTTNIFGTGSITNIGSSGTVTLSGSIGGGGVYMSGSGVMALSGSNSYAGPTIVSSGSLRPENNHALGAGITSTVVSNGAQLYIDVSSTITNKPISLAGTGVSSDGALRAGGGGATTIGGVISFTADTQIAVDGGAILNLTNSTGITAPGINLTLSGGGVGNITGPLTLGAGAVTVSGGTWNIAATNTYTGSTIINGGTLIIPTKTALGPVSTFTPAYVQINGGSLGVTNNVTFADGLGGFAANGGFGGFNVGAGATLTISNQISGSGTIIKSGPGTLILSGSNTFSGILNIDTGGNAVSDGILEITSSNAISGVQTPIAIRNITGGASTFELNSTNINILVTQDITLNGRSPSVPAILNAAGTNTLAGNFTGGNGGPKYVIESDSGLLTMGSSGTVLTFTTADPQMFTFQGNGSFSVAGVISDGLAATGVEKDGNGSLTLKTVNTYTGATTVNGGTLAGTGTISGPVNVTAGGTLSPGTPFGTLTINNSLTLAGSTSVAVNKTSHTNSQVAGLTGVTYGGTLVVTNVSGTLVSGDSFQVFPATTFSGNFSSISPAPGSGLTWKFNPTNGILSVVTGGIPTTPTNITFSVSGGNMTLSWPQSYTGWILQAQTNSLAVGITTNWVNVASSVTTNSVTMPVNPANPTVFFRLRSP